MHQQLEELVDRDPRYPIEAYKFVFKALAHTQRMLGRGMPSTIEEELEELEARTTHHVSGREILNGIRDLALREFGLMAPVVFRLWGIHRTGDFGNVVFNLIEANLMSKTDQDSLEDFEDVYLIDELVKDYEITIEDE